MFLTASKDHTAKLFDAYTLEEKKTYKTERPVNSAAISPNLQHVKLLQLLVAKVKFLCAGGARRRAGSYGCDHDVDENRKV